MIRPLAGRIQALGKIRGIIVHRNFPIARTFPSLSGIARTSDR